MWTRLFKVLLFVLLADFPEAYDKRCPHISQRTFRSHCVCAGAHTYYSCLFDTNRDDFSEYCNIQPDFSAPGEYYVFTGSRRNIECTNTTYQPNSLWSNESSRCIFQKSMCNQVGQVLYKLGSATEDNQCRCDYTNRYAFVFTPTNRCFCIPSKEDCSCYIKLCGLGFILNADYECKLQSQRRETKCEAIENIGVTEKRDMQIENSSDPTKISKSEKEVIPTIASISVVLVFLLVLILLVWNCGKGKVLQVNQSGSSTNLIMQEKDLPDSAVPQINQELSKADSAVPQINQELLEPDSAVPQINQELLEPESAVPQINQDLLEPESAVPQINQDLLEPDSAVPQINQELLNPERDKTTNFEDFRDFRDFKVVAAIDIGSTSSWYASSTTDKFYTNPLDIKVDQSWMVSGTSYLPIKTATCILMTTDGSFKSLGHEAQQDYAELLLFGEADKYLFFDKFKMGLYKNENISKEMLIKDVKGREMKAIDVFSSFIYELMNRVKNSYAELQFNDIQWVLTVPAVWSDKAKTFMRHCAEKKGVRGERLIIALEPEAVSVYFQYLHNFQPTDVPELDRRYVVVDIGGGTVDITAHEKTDNGDLIELCTTTGDDIGGREVDKNFLVLLGNIIGEQVMNSLSTDDRYMYSYFDILKEIENFKRNILVSDRKNLGFRIPFYDLFTLCKEYNSKSLDETIGLSKYSTEISLKRDRIIFPRSRLLSLFHPVGKRITTNIRQVIEELKDLQINMILLAGGLSMSPVIVKILEESFESMKFIKLPQKYSADLAVVMGAVLYGHRPHLISSRITEYTYGRVVQPTFEKEKHDPAKLITINGIDLCNDVFEVLVQKNTRVNLNATIRKEYKEVRISQTQIRIAVYTTKKDKVDYVDDAECRLFCEVIVPLSESDGQPSCVVVDFIFGNTEFHVTACEKETGFQYKVSVELK